MKDEDIIRMANAAGWDAENLEDGFGARLKRFTELALAYERESCAQVCEGRLQEGLNFEGCAASIRARGRHLKSEC